MHLSMIVTSLTTGPAYDGRLSDDVVASASSKLQAVSIVNSTVQFPLSLPEHTIGMAISAHRT